MEWSKFAIQAELVEVVRGAVLIVQKLVNRRLATHGFADDFDGGFPVNFEEGLGVDFFFVQNGWIEPYGINDAEVVGFFPGDDAFTDGIEDTVGDGSLNGAHQNIGVFGRFDGHFTDHDGGGANLHVAVEDSENARMALDLIADQICQSDSNRPVKLADHHFRLCTKIRRFAFDKSFASAKNDALGHDVQVPLNRRKTLDDERIGRIQIARFISE